MSSPLYTRRTIPIEGGIVCEILESNPEGIISNGSSLETLITGDVELNNLIDSAAEFINRKYGEKYTDLGREYGDGFTKGGLPFKRSITSNGYEGSFATEILNLRVGPPASHVQNILLVFWNTDHRVIGTCLIKANCKVGVYKREYIPALTNEGVTKVSGDNCISFHSVSAEKGFGKTVMSESLKYAYTNGFRYAIIEVYYREEDKKLIKFYEKCGFTEIPNSTKDTSFAPGVWKQLAMYKEITQDGGNKYRKSRTYRKSRNYKKSRTYRKSRNYRKSRTYRKSRIYNK
jgi:GNAT superfamily N-acetyltransferase